jgi:steroid Delta-isomerase
MDTAVSKTSSVNSDTAQHAAAQIAHAFETLTVSSIPQLAALYTAQARFKDPFNEVQGRSAIALLFTHMFEQVSQPRFVVTASIAQGQQLFMRWDFDFIARGKARRIHGATHFELNAAGHITLHRDYWDAAQELYETLPLLGSVLRWLRGKLAAPVT